MSAPDGTHPNTDTLPYRGTSAGGGYSTVEDLLHFANALQQNQAPQRPLHRAPDHRQTRARADKYAYGFVDRTMRHALLRPGGGAPGMNGDLKICPGPGYVIAVLANVDPPAAQREADFVGSRLPAR